MVKGRILSFKYAISGVIIGVKEGVSLRWLVFDAILAILLGFYFAITSVEWMILIVMIGLMISLELTNTAIEEIVDSFTSEVHPAAKKAKDVAAGAVFVASMTALIVSLLIFIPYFLDLLQI